MTIRFGGDGYALPVRSRAAMTIDRLPPQNLEAEEGVLGSMMLDESVIDDVMMVLRPSDFYRDSHEVICGAIFDLRSGGVAVDSITVEERLRLGGNLGKAGGLDAVLSILGSVPHAANGRYYAQIVVEKAIARDLIEAANGTIRDGYSDNFTAEDLLEASERRVYAIRDGRERRDASTAAEAAGLALVEIDRRREHGFIPGVRTGWEEVDTLVGGSDAEQVVIVGARPSMGKTAFALQWAAHVASAHRLRPLFISLEMTASELATRLLSVVSGVDSMKFRMPRLLTDFDLRELESARETVAGWAPIVFDDTPSVTVRHIAAAGRRMQRSGGLGIVFVDYLQLVQPEDSREPRHEQIARISRSLKTTARELGVPVVALCQLNREVEKHDDKRPRMAHIRESGQIEQDAHAILLLHRPEYYDPADSPGMAEVIVAKNKNGATGTAKLIFVKKLTRFDSFAPEAGDDDQPY